MKYTFRSLALFFLTIGSVLVILGIHNGYQTPLPGYNFTQEEIGWIIAIPGIVSIIISLILNKFSK